LNIREVIATRNSTLYNGVLVIGKIYNMQPCFASLFGAVRIWVKLKNPRKYIVLYGMTRLVYPRGLPPVHPFCIKTYIFKPITLWITTYYIILLHGCTCVKTSHDIESCPTCSNRFEIMPVFIFELIVRNQWAGKKLVKFRKKCIDFQVVLELNNISIFFNWSEIISGSVSRTSTFYNTILHIIVFRMFDEINKRLDF